MSWPAQARRQITGRPTTMETGRSSPSALSLPSPGPASTRPIPPPSLAGGHSNGEQPPDFVINPLKQAAGNDSQPTTAIGAYVAASEEQQGKWHDAYAKALKDAKVSNGQVTVASGDYGPVPQTRNRLLQLRRTGALDGLVSWR